MKPSDNHYIFCLLVVDLEDNRLVQTIYSNNNNNSTFLFVTVYVVLGNYYDHTGLIVAMDEMDLFKNGKGISIWYLLNNNYSSLLIIVYLRVSDTRVRFVVDLKAHFV